MDEESEAVFTVTNFPRLGCPNFCWPIAHPSPHGNVSQSLFYPDECINPHPRFPNLTRNIRLRRGKKVHGYARFQYAEVFNGYSHIINNTYTGRN